MKVIILSGGKGTRMGKLTESMPKPMVEVEGMPMIFHIMKIYAKYNFSKFILCTGYKSDIFKRYFLNFMNLYNDFTLDMKTGKITKYIPKEKLDWTISVINTGINTQTGGRIRYVKDFIEDDEYFAVTYGDGLTDIDVNKLLDFHKKHGKIATVTAVRPRERFGTLQIDKNNEVHTMLEKETLSYINGGYFIFSRKIFDYIENDQSILEKDVLPKLANISQLIAYKHNKNWICVDYYHELELLRKEDIFTS